MKTRILFVRCKQHPENEFQFWMQPHSGIFSTCTCGTNTSYGSDRYENPHGHYDRFQVDLDVPYGKQYSDETYDLAMETLKLDPEQYRVENFEPLPEHPRRLKGK